MGAAEEEESKAVRNPSPPGWAALLWAGDQRLGVGRGETSLALRKKGKRLWERKRSRAKRKPTRMK